MSLHNQRIQSQIEHHKGCFFGEINKYYLNNKFDYDGYDDEEILPLNVENLTLRHNVFVRATVHKKFNSDGTFNNELFFEKCYTTTAGGSFNLLYESCTVKRLPDLSIVKSDYYIFHSNNPVCGYRFEIVL